MAFSFTSQVKPGQRRAGEGQEQERAGQLSPRQSQGRAGQGREGQGRATGAPQGPGPKSGLDGGICSLEGTPLGVPFLGGAKRGV